MLDKTMQSRMNLLGLTALAVFIILSALHSGLIYNLAAIIHESNLNDEEKNTENLFSDGKTFVQVIDGKKHTINIKVELERVPLRHLF
jgi:hypothetical protein